MQIMLNELHEAIMKKISLIVIAITALALFASACSSVPQGLSVASSNGDLIVRGVNNVEGYSPAVKVLASDSLYMNGSPDDGKILAFKKQKNGEYILPKAGKIDRLPKYIFQIKDGLFNREEYLWAAGITQDYKIQTILMDENSGDIVKGQKEPIKGVNPKNNSKTFDVFGSEIKAVKANDGSTVYFDPYKLSFMLNETESIDKLVQFSYNGMDIQIYDLNDPAVTSQVNRKVKALLIDLKYGNRFTFITGTGKYPNISKELYKENYLKLTGVKLALNDYGNEPYYLFEVISTGNPKEALLAEAQTGDIKTEKHCDNDCNGYFHLKLKPAHHANNENYAANGYISLNCCDIYKRDKMLFMKLVSWGAIGYDKETGRNQEYTRIDPNLLLSYNPVLYSENKHRIKRPG